MKKTLLLCAVCALALALSSTFVPPQKASALGSLSNTWQCGGSYPSCSFTVTSNNHAAYKWNFGDGTFSSCSTSQNASHLYSVGIGEHHFDASLIGYNSTACSSPDNIIGCSITVGNGGPGGNPGYSGTCS